MKRFGVILMLLLATLWTAPSFARGGQSADDCPPNSKDPDCASR